MYVFVSRRDRGLHLTSMDDPALRSLKIGVQLVGEDGANTPPAHALAVRNLSANVVGYTLYGNYTDPNPPARIVDAVAKGEVDTALVWGPLAGYFASKQRVPLTLTPVAGSQDPAAPMAFDIGVGVARRSKELRDEIDAVLARRRIEINRLLDSYGVPRETRVAHAH
jgi:mxaJ protein